MKMYRKNVLLSLTVLAAILPMAVSAATYYVAPPPTGDDGNAGTSAAPFATIQRALDAVTTGNCWDDTKIIIAAGTYKIDSELTPTPNTYLFGIESVSGDPSDVTIDAQGLSRCFNCTSTHSLSFKGITFINGSASGDGGGVLATKRCSFDDCVFRNCSATGNGGAVCVKNDTVGFKYLRNVMIEGCSATSNGGGVYATCYSGAALTDADGMSNCRIYNCSAGAHGGGMFLQGKTLSTVSECVIRNCSATGSGGGIYVNDSFTHISNVLVDGCSATTSTSDGGGIYVAASLSGSDGISNCRIYNCSAGNRGGGVYIYGTTLSTVSECDISCNTASGAAGGGGIFAWNAAISNCTVTNNVCDYASDAGTGGSGIRLDTFGTIEGCLVKGNSFTYDCSAWNGGGSAVYLATGSSLVNSAIIGNSGSRSVGMQWTNGGGILVSNCLFKSNVARRTDGSGRGGIMELYGLNADSLITDCRFIDNQAAASAGFLEAYLNSGSGDATLRIRNCLISGNVVSAGSGMIWANSGKSATARRLAVENCTFVSNTIPAGPVIMPYVESAQWTSTNFVSVSGCAILFNNGKDAFDNTFKVSANVAYNCTELSGMSEGNITYDSSKPLFEDVANGNFRPAKNSQLCNVVPVAAWMGDGSKRSTSRDLGTGYEIRPAGTYGVDVVWTDSVPRLYGIAADIGCGEYYNPSGFMMIVR
jgi:hypothetical protein